MLQLSYRWQYWDPVAAMGNIAGATTATELTRLGIVSNTTIRRVAYASQNVLCNRCSFRLGLQCPPGRLLIETGCITTNAITQESVVTVE